MACLYSLKGIALDVCDSNLAGVKSIFITDNLNGITAALSAESALTISGITVPEGAEFLEYQLERWQGYMTSTPNYNDSGRLLYYTNEVRVAFPKLQADRMLEFAALTHNPVYIIVLDNNGKYWYLGYDTYLSATSGSAATGQASGDENGFEIILSTDSAYPPLSVDEAIVTPVIERQA